MARKLTPKMRAMLSELVDGAIPGYALDYGSSVKSALRKAGYVSVSKLPSRKISLAGPVVHYVITDTGRAVLS